MAVIISDELRSTIVNELMEYEYGLERRGEKAKKGYDWVDALEYIESALSLDPPLKKEPEIPTIDKFKEDLNISLDKWWTINIYPIIVKFMEHAVNHGRDTIVLEKKDFKYDEIFKSKYKETHFNYAKKKMNDLGYYFEMDDCEIVISLENRSSLFSVPNTYWDANDNMYKTRAKPFNIEINPLINATTKTNIREPKYKTGSTSSLIDDTPNVLFGSQSMDNSIPHGNTGLGHVALSSSDKRSMLEDSFIFENDFDFKGCFGVDKGGK